MIVLMHAGASAEQAAAVIESIESKGLKALNLPGGEHIAIGLFRLGRHEHVDRLWRRADSRPQQPQRSMNIDPGRSRLQSWNVKRTSKLSVSGASGSQFPRAGGSALRSIV